MFILPPNCMVPSASSLTMSPVLPNFLYFIFCTPSAANENCASWSRICLDSNKNFEPGPAAPLSEIIVPELSLRNANHREKRVFVNARSARLSDIGGNGTGSVRQRDESGVGGPLPVLLPSTVYNSGSLRVSLPPRLAHPHRVVTRMPTYRTELSGLVARHLCPESDLSPSTGSSTPMRSQRSVRFCVRRALTPSAPNSRRRRQETSTPTSPSHLIELVDNENDTRLRMAKNSFSLERQEIRHESNHFGKE